MSAQPLQSEENESGTVIALASERARLAQRAWREAQQKRLEAAQRAEQLALELRTAEEHKRLELAQRVERLELELRRAAQAGPSVAATLPFGPEARRRARRAALVAYLAVAAIGVALGVGAMAYWPDISALLETPAPVRAGAAIDPLQLRLSYRFSAQ